MEKNINISTGAPNDEQTKQKTLESSSKKNELITSPDSMWKFTSAELKSALGQPIGKGSFGVVYKGVFRGKEVAIKKFYTQNLDDELMMDIKSEMRKLLSLSHPNIVLCMGACLEKNDLMIVTEYMPKGSVEEVVLKAKDPPSLTIRIKMLKDVASGMSWLHSLKPPLLHLDLQTSNLLVDNNFSVKVSDFGLSKYKKMVFDAIDTKGSGASGHIYTAPEILLRKSISEKCDIYSFSMVTWELYYTNYALKDFTFQDLNEVIYNGLRPSITKPCSLILEKLLNSCWDIQPNNRPTFDQIIISLNELFIETALQDEKARTFWVNNFQAKESVTWNNFLPAIVVNQSLNMIKNDIEIKCINAILVDSQDVVTQKQFSTILDWFGPFDSAFSSRIRDTLALPYFFGDINASQASIFLQPHHKKTFLVRFSSQPGEYTISAKPDDKQITNVRITKKGNYYVLGKHETTNLDKLINLIKKEYKLKHECKGSKYAKIFSVNSDHLQPLYSDPTLLKK